VKRKVEFVLRQVTVVWINLSVV